MFRVDGRTRPGPGRFAPTMKCPLLSAKSQRGLIIYPSLTKNHTERIKHPACDLNNVWADATGMITQWNKPADERWAEMFARFRSRDIPQDKQLWTSVITAHVLIQLLGLNRARDDDDDDDDYYYYYY